MGQGVLDWDTSPSSKEMFAHRQGESTSGRVEEAEAEGRLEARKGLEARGWKVKTEHSSVFQGGCTGRSFKCLLSGCALSGSGVRVTRSGQQLKTAK